MKFIFYIAIVIASLSVKAQPGMDNMYWAILQSKVVIPPAGNIDFSFVEYAYANNDLINPGRGAEQWNNGSEAILYPSTTDNQLTQDLYYRKEWAEFEGDIQGSYTWDELDEMLQEAVDNGQQLSFGIMQYNSNGGFTDYGGASSSYPLYLHTAMQALSAGNKDVITPEGIWMPNWNSAVYLARLRALNEAINAYLLTKKLYPIVGPHAGEEVAAKDVIYCIDIRGFGDFGEWHSNSMYPFGSFPGNTEPTAATLMEIIDCHTEVFASWPLSMMVAAFNGTGGAYYVNIFHKYNQVGHYALTATNAWGKVGYRRDQVGATDTYLSDLLENNNSTYSGSPAFKTLFLDLFNTAPGTGEPLPGAASINGMVTLEQQIIDYGATSFGNGNWLGFPTPIVQDRIRAAFKRSGYRIKITTGDAPQLITRDVGFTIRTNWVNVGTTPAYNHWVVQFELQDSDDDVVWTGISNKALKLFRPNQGTVLTTDVLSVPNTVSAGTYKLVVRVRDFYNYRRNMKLAINTQNADGSYTIFSTVVVN